MVFVAPELGAEDYVDVEADAEDQAKEDPEVVPAESAFNAEASDQAEGDEEYTKHTAYDCCNAGCFSSGLWIDVVWCRICRESLWRR